MAKVIKTSDQSELVNTNKYPYASFPFSSFNCVQSRVMEFFDQECNAVIASKTSSGKTVCSELFLAHEVRKRGGKGLYLAPLKALASEKEGDWTSPDHHFYDLNVSICTGDYLLTPSRRNELEKADIIVMSSEMLNSRGRNFKSENNSWLNKVGTVAIDESHLLTMPERGHHLESGLIKFSKLNPKGRMVLLSATMPNVDEISGWVSQLTNRDTYFLESNYRPCPLFVHHEKYDDDVYSYESGEQSKCYKALEIIADHEDDKFLVFSHSKKTARMMYEMLKRSGYVVELHTGDLETRKRKEVEHRFKNDKSLKIIVATSGLAAGINMPARRVIILGVHRGLSDVAVYEIEQMMGRAGRPQYDQAGDVYILLPRSNFDRQVHRLSHPQRIESQLFNPKNFRCNRVLAFHLVSEIHHKGVQTSNEVGEWYKDTLAHYQNRSLDDYIVENTITDLSRCGAIKEEEGVLRANAIGRVASMFYYNPFDVADLAKNFSKIFVGNKEQDDHWLSAAFAWTDTHKLQIINTSEKEECASYQSRLHRMGVMNSIAPNGWRSDGATKVAYAYFCLLRGIHSATFNGLMSTIKADFGRVKQVLQALDIMSYHWNKSDYFTLLEERVKKGLPVELLDLAQLAGVGKVKAQKLIDHGIKTISQLGQADFKAVCVALSCTMRGAEKLVTKAKEFVNEQG